MKTLKTIRKRWRRLLSEGGFFVGGAILAVVLVVPVLYTIVSSLKSAGEIFVVPMRWVPRTVHLDNFSIPLIRQSFWIYFLNSIVVAAAVTASALFFCSLAGYSLAKFQYFGRKFFFLLVLVTIMVPIEVILVPLAIIVKVLGLTDSYAGLIIPVALTPFGIFWMRQFIVTLPGDYIDSGRVDGLNELQIFWHLILRLSTPAVAALGIFTFMGNWNSLMWPLIVISRNGLRTVPVGLLAFQGEFYTPYNQLFAMSVLAVVPTGLFFVALRERLIQGMAMVGIKG